MTENLETHSAEEALADSQIREISLAEMDEVSGAGLGCLIDRAVQWFLNAGGGTKAPVK